jgi:hypothetical protein
MPLSQQISAAAIHDLATAFARSMPLSQHISTAAIYGLAGAFAGIAWEVGSKFLIKYLDL